MLYEVFCAPSALSHDKLRHFCGLKHNVALLSYRVIFKSHTMFYKLICKANMG